MILETTNPKYQTRPQIPAGRRYYITTPERSDLEFISEGSRSMARGELQTEHFVDRKPHEAPIRNLEPEPKSRGSSLQLFDETHDGPLWLIIDVFTGAVFARVPGSQTVVGRRRRRTQLAIEFTMCAIPVLTIGIACGAAL